MRAHIVLAGAIVAAIAAVLGIAAALGAFSSSGSPAAAPAAGTRVEGHATIAVLGTNGKPIRRSRIDLHFLPLGPNHAGRAVWGILSGRNVAGDWDVTLAGTACPKTNRLFCQLYEADATTRAFDATADAKKLKVALASAGPGAFETVLAGTLPIARSGTIVRVATGLQSCPPVAKAGRDCDVFYDPISDQALPTPVRVSARQRLSIRVEIGFGT